MVLREIKIDAEFQSRLEPQTPEEAEVMRESIDERGYLNPLIVWKDKGILVDGHHRYFDWQRRQAEYEAAKPKGLGAKFRSQPKPPPTPDIIQMEFSDRQAVLRFIDEKQYGQRNLTEAQKQLIRARFIRNAKGTMSTMEAVKETAAKFDVSERTALRDAETAADLETIEPIAQQQCGQSAESLMLALELSRTEVKEIANDIEKAPVAAKATVLEERLAEDRRKKPTTRLDGASSPKPPSWEKHLASLTKALDALWKDSVDEERAAVKARIRELVEHVKQLEKAIAV